jgi:PmbA protein
MAGVRAHYPRDPAQYVLDRLSDRVHADLRLETSGWTTIRFAAGRIHQPALDTSAQLSLRVEDDRRIGVATTTDLSADGLSRVVRSAEALARVAPREPKFPGFSRAKGRAPSVPYSARTARTDPEAACRTARTAIDAAADVAPGARATGVVHVGGSTLRVVNTEGLDRATRRSAAQMSVLVEGPDRDTPVSGWSEGAHWDLARLAPERIGREAAERMPRSPPQAVASGAYRVVLRGPAVVDLLGFLAQLGFGGVAEVDGSSCLLRHRGKRHFPTSLTLVDDPRSAWGLPSAIDAEGSVARRRALIDKGVVGPASADLLIGGRLGRSSTGDAFPPESPWGEVGPMPSHLVLAAGDASEEELIRETRRGLLVTRFHYVRTVNPADATITGMTRDGTYRIENGEVVEPVRNLRFTQSVVGALQGVFAIGRERRIYGAERASISTTAPAIACEKFRFTSATMF